MADNSKDERLAQFERSLDPNVAKFAPHKKTDDSIDGLVERIRASVKHITELCDELDKAVAESEKHARAAADSLMAMVQKVR